jgi:hypothetical protein
MQEIPAFRLQEPQNQNHFGYIEYKNAAHINRSTDSDYVIVKDAQLAQSMVDTTRRALSIG